MAIFKKPDYATYYTEEEVETFLKSINAIRCRIARDKDIGHLVKLTEVQVYEYKAEGVEKAINFQGTGFIKEALPEKVKVYFGVSLHDGVRHGSYLVPDEDPRNFSYQIDGAASVVEVCFGPRKLNPKNFRHKFGRKKTDAGSE